jgi:hypothetical protein
MAVQRSPQASASSAHDAQHRARRSRPRTHPRSQCHDDGLVGRARSTRCQAFAVSFGAPGTPSRNCERIRAPGATCAELRAKHFARRSGHPPGVRDTRAWPATTGQVLAFTPAGRTTAEHLLPPFSCGNQQTAGDPLRTVAQRSKQTVNLAIQPSLQAGEAPPKRVECN